MLTQLVTAAPRPGGRNVIITHALTCDELEEGRGAYRYRRRWKGEMAVLIRWYCAAITALAVVASLAPFVRAFGLPSPLQKPASMPASARSSPGALHETPNDAQENKDAASTGNRHPLPIRRAFLISSLVAGAQFLFAQAYAPPGFERIQTQFMAALGDPNASKGTGAQDWGLWELDPGPRGVRLRNYDSQLVNNNNVAPAGWKFDSKDWWLEEHGLIMEAPKFPVAPGRYLVTGGRLVTTILTVDDGGSWKLDDGKLYDVTHLPCRSARYTPTSEGGSPLTARQFDFPVTPGAEMPAVPGCNKQDYAVLFVIGKEATGAKKEL